MQFAFLREEGERDLFNIYYQDEVVVAESCLTMRNATFERINIAYSTIILDNCTIKNICAKDSIVFLRNSTITNLNTTKCSLNFYKCNLGSIEVGNSTVRFDESECKIFKPTETKFEIKNTVIERLFPNRAILTKYTSDKETSIVVELDKEIFTNQTDYRISEIHCNVNHMKNYIGVPPKKIVIYLNSNTKIVELWRYGDSELDIDIRMDGLLFRYSVRVEGMCKVKVNATGSFGIKLIFDPMLDIKSYKRYGSLRDPEYNEKKYNRYYTSMIIGKLEEGKLPGFEKDKYLCDRRMSWLIDEFLN